MERKHFEELVKNNNAIPLNEEGYILFNDLELYNSNINFSKYFESFEELYRFEFEGKTFGNFVDDTESFVLKYNGGRGANYDSKMGGGFAHASGGGRGSKEKTKFTAEFNADTKVGQRFRTYKEVEMLFRRKYQDADHEFGIAVDRNGFVTRHIEGGATSVRITGNKGETIIHNHPSNGNGNLDGGNFSDSDLLSTAYTNSRGIVAISRDYTHTFEKNSNFKAKDFIKAVKKAQWPDRYNYNDGADWWLRQNAKRYGYTYSRVSSK